MKKIKIITAVLLLICLGLQATKAQGIFNQKSSQLRRLAEQIAALRVYGDYLNKGYDIARSGLTTISDIKQGDFNLHRTFFGSLKAVNPNIKRYARTADILIMNLNIIKSYQVTIRAAKNSGMFGEEDLEFIKGTLTKLLTVCGALLDDLSDLVTDGRIELKDDERMQRIDQLYAETLELYIFHGQFSGDVFQLAAIKQHELRELQFENQINGIIRE